MFSCEFYQSFKNNFFYRTPLAAVYAFSAVTNDIKSISFIAVNVFVNVITSFDMFSVIHG